MSNKQYSLSDLILDNLFNLRGLFGSSYGVAYALAMKQRKVSAREFGQAVNRMRSRQLLEITEKNNQRFIKLTQEGQLTVLFVKAKVQKPREWDGKWRLIIFDIPENSKEQRSILRGLLRDNNFCKLQASVYISPYPLNREAVSYLSRSGLSEYIRILKVEEMDSDKELLKRYGLKRITKNHGR
jgi:DNA-binding transcriptional regulator PaaX